MAEILKENELEKINGGAINNNLTVFVYFIQTGDTLSGIAKKFDTTVATLISLNNISNPDKIYAGHKLYIPYNN